MDFDQILIERHGYTITDLLSDVGGLHGILISAISLALGIVNLNYLEDYLVTKLFKSPTITLKVSSTCENFKEFILSLFPCCKFKCFRKNQKQIEMTNARTALS